MDLSQITQGQKDWVKTLNSNIQKLTISEETTRDLVYKNGWSTFGNDEAFNFVTKIKTIAGSVLYYYVFDLQCAQMSPGVDDGAVQFPDGFMSGRAYPTGRLFPIETSTNSFGHVVMARFTTGNNLNFKCININGTAAEVWKNERVSGAMIWM